MDSSSHLEPRPVVVADVYEGTAHVVKDPLQQGNPGQVERQCKVWRRLKLFNGHPPTL